MARVLCRAMVGQRPGVYHGRDSRCLPVQAGSYRFSCHFSTNDGEYDYRNPSVGIEFILTEKGRSRLSRLHVIWVLMGPLSSMIPSGDGRLTISCPSARTSIQGIPLGSPMRCAWAASCARAVSRSATHNRACHVTVCRYGGGAAIRWDFWVSQWRYLLRCDFGGDHFVSM